MTSMNKWLTKKLGKEMSRMEKSKKSEDNFFDFCSKNKISCQKLDNIESDISKNKYLNNPKGNCPDFLITKGDLSCFVEVKTLTNFTNAKREKEIDKKRELLQQSCQSGVLVSDVIDFTSELKGPFRTFVQSASAKFKNIKPEYLYPRILLLDGFTVDEHSVNAIFNGSYRSYIKVNNKLQCIGFQRKKSGLFDKTGSNISAVIYFNQNNDRYFGVENSRAVVKFSEECFYHFFIKT